MVVINGIGLDSSAKVAFQSHAHTDHFVSGDMIVSTKATKYLSHLRKGGFYKVHPLGKSFYIGDYKAKLLPAGHMLGSAQIYIEFDEFSLLYTGDVKWFKLRTAEKSRFKKADVLIIEATFGVPHFNFPSPREAEKKLIAFIEEALDMKKTPTLYANQMGKAQELLKILDVHGYTVKASREIIKVAKVYEKFGISFHNIDRDGEVVLRGFRSVKPENGLHPSELFVSGFGSLKLSNHADFWELMRIVEKVKPEKIYTRYGYAKEFAKILRGLGYDAHPMDERKELEILFSKS
ncbi:mRNA 3'-end processing factor [Palaeococcus pacificus DY20341]|uniref:mRNA 3'-end processing factor n=1 Tax=Palaeococcus pacificus DY20341 TaxID=1343739 RepID=A0A075LUI7_9EURY|nr:MBL fold metallo-hydrolase [Palaeococcus pacificus]AIF70039.1 mRNA 3'-end processing factor [Palaeococcus pacificus DY20341]